MPDDAPIDPIMNALYEAEAAQSLSRALNFVRAHAESFAEVSAWLQQEYSEPACRRRLLPKWELEWNHREEDLRATPTPRELDERKTKRASVAERLRMAVDDLLHQRYPVEDNATHALYSMKLVRLAVSLYYPPPLDAPDDFAGAPWEELRGGRVDVASAHDFPLDEFWDRVTKAIYSVASHFSSVQGEPDGQADEVLPPPCVFPPFAMSLNAMDQNLALGSLAGASTTPPEPKIKPHAGKAPGTIEELASLLRLLDQEAKAASLGPDHGEVRTAAGVLVRQARDAGVFAGARYGDLRPQLSFMKKGSTSFWRWLCEWLEREGRIEPQWENDSSVLVRVADELVLIAGEAKDSGASPLSSAEIGRQAMELIADRAGTEPRLAWLKVYLDISPNASLRSIEEAAKVLGHSLPRSSINGLLKANKWIGHPPRGKARQASSADPGVMASSLTDGNTRRR